MLGTLDLQVQSTGFPSIFCRAQPCTLYSEYTVQVFFFNNGLSDRKRKLSMDPDMKRQVLL